MTSTFKPGQVVQFKSGGPFMTVNAVENDDKLHCRWFWQGQLFADTFICDILKPVESDGTSKTG